uniref:Uncharacterized protein n=1 Tax=Anopheles culicifacies TaxID=139723 RepID=A0A182MCX9_9DIPT
MEYKVDMERAIIADFVKPSPSKRCRTAAYALTALSSIFLGALAMALFYHWNELQTVGNRVEVQHVQEVIRLADVLLAKHETNAANVEKLLTTFQHKLQSIESKLRSKEDDVPFESNLTYDEAKDKNHEQNEVKIEEATKIDVQIASESDEAKQPESTAHDDENEQSSESFQWSWSFPQSWWLKLSPYGINHGTASENMVASNELE